MTPGNRTIALNSHKIGFLLSGALLLALASCSNTVSQCGQLAAVINQSQSVKDDFEKEIESAKIKAAGSSGLPELKTAAQEYTTAVQTVAGQIDSMGQDLDELNIDDDQLDEYRDRYVTVLTDYQKALSGASEAMQLVVEAKDENEFRDIFDNFQSKANGAFNDIQLSNAQEADLVGLVNGYCTEQAG